MQPPACHRNSQEIRLDAQSRCGSQANGVSESLVGNSSILSLLKQIKVSTMVYFDKTRSKPGDRNIPTLYN